VPTENQERKRSETKRNECSGYMHFSSIAARPELNLFWNPLFCNSLLHPRVLLLPSLFPVSSRSRGFSKRGDRPLRVEGPVGQRKGADRLVGPKSPPMVSQSSAQEGAQTAHGPSPEGRTLTLDSSSLLTPALPHCQIDALVWRRMQTSSARRRAQPVPASSLRPPIQICDPERALCCRT